MPHDVQILPQPLINKIAAGEVIVRPASVVKELVENSFDAEARHVRVEVSRDARSISVVDDGCGMDEANARRAVLRHSTSKIREFEDLEHLLTRGFRGEAVASIISISRFEMLTRRREDLAGVRLTAAGGRIEKVEPVGVASGTAIHVRDLFYNTPARLKFLKSPGAEVNALAQLLTQQALSRPDVGVTLVRDGEVRFDLPAGQDLRSRIEDLLGGAVRGRLIAVDFERDGLRVTGFVSRPEASRKDRRGQYLMINSRPIAAKQLTYPLQEAFRGLLMKQRFPIAVLDLHLDLTEVDVNVHPTKEEVRFEEDRKVAGLLHRAVSQALAENQLIPDVEMPDPSAPETPLRSETPQRSDPRRGVGMPKRADAQAADPSLDFLFSTKGVRPFSRSDAARPPHPPARSQDFFPPRSFASPSDAPPPETETPAPPPCEGPGRAEPSLEPPRPQALRLGEGEPPAPLGQVADAYIMADWQGNLLMIDQHAAHERLLYKRICERGARRPDSQQLLAPIAVEIPPADAETAETLGPVLEEMGFALERGEGCLFVTALPTDCDSVDAEALVGDLLAAAHERDGSAAGQDALEELRDQARIRMACHAAVKAGQRLHPNEIAALVRDITEARLSFTCPHGRPTMVLLRREQLERQFGRK